MKSLSIKEFCSRHGISASTYFKLAAAGEGPKVYRIGDAVRITEEAAAAWLAARMGDAA